MNLVAAFVDGLNRVKRAPWLVIGVWLGNSDNTPIVHIYSTSIAFRAMRDILLAAFDRPNTAVE